MISVVFTPQRTEYVGYFVELAEQYDVVIAEVPNVEGVGKFLRGEIDLDSLFYEIEYFDPIYTREFYNSLRRLESRGFR